jgi:hypothetical protein
MFAGENTIRSTCRLSISTFVSERLWLDTVQGLNWYKLKQRAPKLATELLWTIACIVIYFAYHIGLKPLVVSAAYYITFIAGIFAIDYVFKGRH